MGGHGPAIAAIVLTTALATPAAAAPDGAALFTQRCAACHAAPAGQPHGIGPNLAGVVGRKAASTAFAYSAALTKSGLVWNPATLDRYLAGPQRLVPGTRMVVMIPDPAQRAAIIDYLAHKTK